MTDMIQWDYSFLTKSSITSTLLEIHYYDKVFLISSLLDDSSYVLYKHLNVKRIVAGLIVKPPVSPAQPQSNRLVQ